MSKESGRSYVEKMAQQDELRSRSLELARERGEKFPEVDEAVKKRNEAETSLEQLLSDIGFQAEGEERWKKKYEEKRRENILSKIPLVAELRKASHVLNGLFGGANAWTQAPLSKLASKEAVQDAREKLAYYASLADDQNILEQFNDKSSALVKAEAELQLQILALGPDEQRQLIEMQQTIFDLDDESVAVQ